MTSDEVSTPGSDASTASTGPGPTSTVSTCIWMDRQAEQAAEHYSRVVPGCRITSVARYPDENPYPVEDDRAGSAMTVSLDVAGHQVMLLNGGPQFPLTEAVSLVVAVPDQPTLDRVWDGLLAEGGTPSQCGWLTDRFGLSWQVVPQQMERYFSAGPDAANRVNAALAQMVKIDIPTLDAALRG